MEWGGFHLSCACRELEGGAIKRGGTGQLGDRDGQRTDKGRREEREEAASFKSLTHSSMGFSSTIAVGFLLFLAFQIPGQTRANPVYNPVSNADLMDFKNLLDRLEKMPLEDEAVPPQILSDQNDEAGAALNPLPEVPPWTGELNSAQRDGGALGQGPWDSSERSAILKSKMKALLTAPRSLRRSSCFGGRMDRIGAQSGLGCNSFRYRR